MASQAMHPSLVVILAVLAYTALFAEGVIWLNKANLLSKLASQLKTWKIPRHLSAVTPLGPPYIALCSIAVVYGYRFFDGAFESYDANPSPCQPLPGGFLLRAWRSFQRFSDLTYSIDVVLFPVTLASYYMNGALRDWAFAPPLLSFGLFLLLNTKSNLSSEEYVAYLTRKEKSMLFVQFFLS